MRKMVLVFFLFLLSLEILFVVLHFVAFHLSYPWNYIERWFHLNGEGTIPAWFSSSQLFILSGIFAFMAIHGYVHIKNMRLFFVATSLLFLFLSMDEGASIHEGMTEILNDLSWVPAFRSGHGVWIFVYAGAVVFLGFVGLKYLYFLWDANRWASFLMICGFGTWIAGGAGIEIVGYYAKGRVTETNMQGLIALEEFLEMFGVSTMLYASLMIAIGAKDERPLANAARWLLSNHPDFERVEDATFVARSAARSPAALPAFERRGGLQPFGRKGSRA